MKVFKDGGSYYLNVVKYELLEEGVDGIKDSVVFASKEKRKVTFLVGRKIVINQHYIEVEYKLTRDLTDKYKDCTDGEIAKIIAENPDEVTSGFYAYISSTITTICQSLCNLPAILTSTNYIGE